MDMVIVSRHPGAVEFLAEQIGLEQHGGHGFAYYDRAGKAVVVGDSTQGLPLSCRIPVLESAGPDDVRGKAVYGNLPLHLAALAAEVVAVEFAGPPPRGQEYGVEEMRAAGARLARYVVRAK